ncbi:PKD domain-containing protein [Candidatus Bipolaricaulota bacterium]|nr:PKD domain-containing protein [Candidatus Bipolaricaulota bacterium]
MWRRILLSGLGLSVLVGLAACTWLFNPLNAVLHAYPQSGEAPLEVTFDISESTGNIVSFTLDFGDGTSASGTDITQPIQHTYGDPGTYTATLTVQDGRGKEDTDSLVIQVKYPELQAVLHADPTEGNAPLTVTFDPSDSVGQITHFLIIFGDGVQTEGTDIDVTIDHTYTQTGSYTAFLFVDDAYGQKSYDYQTIEVH